MNKKLTPSNDNAGPQRILRPVWAAAAVVLIAATACSVSGAGTQLAQLQSLRANCPPGKEVAAQAFLDGSGSDRGASLEQQRLPAVQSLATQTAVCGGHLQVLVFSSSSTATATLFDGDLKPAGATENAQLRRVPAMVDQTMSTVAARLPQAIRSIPANGTDVLGQLGLAQEYATQLGHHYVLHALLLTDGLQTNGVAVTNTPTFTSAVATDLAERVPVPDLHGASVTIAGLGHVAGPPAPTNFVDALKVFFNGVCVRTGATCTVVTDYVNQGS